MADQRKPHDPPAGGGTAVIAQDQTDGWDAIPEALPIELPGLEDRYEVVRELARGSMGVVQVARDLSLQRLVALKKLSTEARVPNAAARFLDEARITAQLSHPGIAAVYEIGVGKDEVPFFSMQLIEGRTLHAMLEGLRAGDPDAVRRFSRARLLNLFMQVCMTVAYAHARGVIHRDLKPENIMLGNFDEVFVMDWGLAKIVSTDVPQPVVGGRPDDAVFRTRVGDIQGTPAYMSPEQAMGLVDALGDRTDVYALGAILYELLTLRPPFGGTTQEVLRLVRQGALVPPAQAAPDAGITAELEAVVLRAMARDPMDRYPTAAALRDEVEASLVGTRTSMHRVRGAARALREAARAGQTFRELARRRRRVAREVAEAASLRLPFDAPDELEALWSRQAAHAALERDVAHAFENAVAHYQQILNEVPDHREAHEGLRDLFWYRFLEAERADDRPTMVLYRGLAQQHDRSRALQAALTGDGALRLATDPPGAAVTLYRHTPAGHRLVASDPRACGSTPLTLEPLAMGSYVVVLERRGFHELRVPVHLTRQETAEVEVRLLPEGALPAGMVQVPAGAWWSGDNNPELETAPRARQAAAAFLIGRCPVTVADYAAFLDALFEGGDAGRAQRHVPGGGEGWQTGPDGRAHPDQYGGNPVTGVSLVDVQAYLAWRAERDGLPWRLPTAAEWERAARGADGRAYPWGDRWDATLCRCADGPEGGAPSAVGNESDESPFGVRDLAGGVREWTASEHPRDARQRAVKGGGFDSRRAECHLAVRRFAKIDRGARDLGFRLALDIEAALQGRGGR